MSLNEFERMSMISDVLDIKNKIRNIYLNKEI